MNNYNFEGFVPPKSSESGTENKETVGYDLAGMVPPSAWRNRMEKNNLAANESLSLGWSQSAHAMQAESDLATLPTVDGYNADGKRISVPATESYDDAGQLQPQQDEHEDVLRRAAYALDKAGRVSPDAALKALQASRMTGQQFSVALKNPDISDRLLNTPDLESLRSTAPRLLQTLADTEASLYARDDVPALGKFEAALDKWSGTVRAMGNVPWRAGPVAGRAASQMGMLAGGIINSFGGNVIGEWGGMYPALVNALGGTYDKDSNLFRALGTLVEDVSRKSADNYQAVLDSPELKQRIDYSVEQVLADPSLMLDPEWLAGQGGDVAVQQLVNIAAYVAGGTPLAALAGGSQEGGAFYQQLREQGMDADLATAAAITYGMGTGVLESFGAASFFGDSAVGTAARNAAMRVVGKMPARAQGAILNAAASTAGAATEGLTEYLENPLQNAIEAIAQGKPLPGILQAIGEGFKDVRPILPSMLMGFGGMGHAKDPRKANDLSHFGLISPEMREIAHMVAGLNEDHQHAQARLHVGKELQAAAEAVDESNLHKRSPQAFEELAAKLRDETVASVWVDAEAVATFAQSGKEAETTQRLEALGVTEEALQQAQQSGAPLQVDTLRLLSRTQGDERTALLDSARLTPDGMTADDARQFNIQDRVDQGLSQIRSTAQQSADVTKEERRIRNEVVHAGFAEHDASYKAMLLAAHARTQYASYGLDPVALLQRVKVEHHAEGVFGGGSGDDKTDAEAQAAQSFAQAAIDKEASRIAGEKTTFASTVDAFGRGEYRGGAAKVGETPAVLQMLGAKGLGLYFPHTKLQKVLHDKHRLPAEIVASLPELLARPVAVFESQTMAGSMVALTQATSPEGMPVIVAVHLDVRQGRHVVNEIASMYGRSNAEAWLEKQVRERTLLYLDKTKAADVQRSAGLQLPKEMHKGGKAKVSSPADLVNWMARQEQGAEGETFKQGTGNKDRAAVEFKSDGSRVIKVFEGADLSSVLHETGHIFLDTLEEVSRGDTSPALAALERRLADITGLHDDLAAIARSAHDVVRGNTQGTLQGLRKQLREHAKQADDAGDKARASQARRAESAIGQLGAHLRGIEKAQADMATVRQWAGVPQEGELTEEQRTQLHETFARGFEAYLREGKAPTQQLAGAFARFRRWLTSIYQDVRQLNVNLTDEVRTVMDRMLATDNAIARHRDVSAMLSGEAGFLAQLSEAAGGFDLRDADALDAMRSEAERIVQQGLDTATLRDRMARLREHRKEATRIVADIPLWQAVDYLAGKGPGLNRAYLVGLYGEDAVTSLAKRRPGLVRNEGGLALDDVATEFGYHDGDGLWNEMYDTLALRRETKAARIESVAQELLAAEDTEADPGDMMAAGDAYGDYLEAVDTVMLKLMAREKGWKTPEQQATRADALRTPREYIKAVASQEIALTPLRDVRPDRYNAALRKALAERTRALASGDLAASFRALEQARIAHELAQMSVKIQRDKQEAERYAQRVSRIRPEVIDPMAREGIRRLLHTYRLGNAGKPMSHADALVPLRDIVTAFSGGEDAAVDALPSFPSWLLEGRAPYKGVEPGPDGMIDYRNLTADNLRDVMDLLHYFEHMGRDARGKERATEGARVKAVADAGAATMQGLPQKAPRAWRGTDLERFERTRDRFWSEHTALRWQFAAADGYANIGPNGTAGPNETALMDKIYDGEEKLRRLRGVMSTQLVPQLDYFARRTAELEKQHGAKLALKGRDGAPIAVPAEWKQAGRNHFTMDNVWSMALNMGNESNRERILAGYPGLQRETVAQLLGDDAADMLFAPKGLQQPHGTQRTNGLLTREDWQAVQQVWNTIGSLWPETEAVHKRMYGFAPRGIETKPFVLAGQGGLLLDGGYYPVRYDPALSDKVALWNESDDILNRNESLFQVPSAKNGHTKARADGAPGLPVRLDTGVLTEHLDDAMRFIALAETVRFADRVTQAPQWKQAYTAAFGDEDHKAIRKNLRGLVRNDAPADSSMVMMADLFRKYVVTTGLSWNIKTALLQSTAIFPAMQDIGAGAVLRGVNRLASRDARAIVEQIKGVSTYMASRAENIDQDMQKLLRGLAPEKRGLSVTVRGHTVDYESVVEAGMLPIVCVDLMATSSVWLGAYEKRMAELSGDAKAARAALKQGIDPQAAGHDDAVRYADSIVKRSNPDFEGSSRSTFLRSNGAARLFNLFSSATELYVQRQRLHGAARKAGAMTTGEYLRFQAYDTLLPATAMWLLQAAARGMFSGSDEDKDKLASSWFASVLDIAAARLPVLGSPLVELMTGDAGSRGGARIRNALDAAVDIGGSAATGVRKIAEKGFKDGLDDALDAENLQKLGWTLGDLVSTLARIPVSQRLHRAVRGYEQWQDGEGTPFSMIMPRPKNQ